MIGEQKSQKPKKLAKRKSGSVYFYFDRAAVVPVAKCIVISRYMNTADWKQPVGPCLAA